MTNKKNIRSELSPFHSGEQSIQQQIGKREVIERVGRRVIRPFMLDQHRDFFQQLPFVVVGSIDDAGWPWASILSGKSGFMNSPDATTLQLTVSPVEDDPLSGAMKKIGSPLGLLGIELTSRRRNRLNGRVDAIFEHGCSVSVDQSFGNCPQYIQRRTVDFVHTTPTENKERSVTSFVSFDEGAMLLMNEADTFFVSSFVSSHDRPDVEGVDVSHRGGRPGFVAVKGNTLTIPDFRGNRHFNTLGNFLVNPKAGLVFVDFTTGDLLMLTGRVELLGDDHPDVSHFKGAERGWRFILDHGIRLNNALPFRSVVEDYSPSTMRTGTWLEAEAARSVQKKRNT